jgi:hypothetical protein
VNQHVNGAGSGQPDFRPPRAGRGGAEPIRTTQPVTTPPRAATAQAVREMGPEATRAWGAWWDRKYQASVNDPDGDVLGIAVRVAVMVRNELVDEINEKLVGESAQKLVDLERELEARIAAAEKRIAAAEASAAAEGRRRDDEADAEFEATNKRISKLRGELLEPEERLKSTAGRLPQVKTPWAEGDVTYEGQLVALDGNLFQARKDTGLRPGDPAAWVCVARAGRDGRDGKELRMRGLYNAARTYARLDVVLLAGEPFMAKHDAPGLCPSEGWLKLGARGAKGAKGAAGPRGPKGEPGVSDATLRIHSWRIDPARYTATPILSNGQVGARLELRTLFEQFLVDAGSAE